jgi:chromosome segregation ATPase
VVYGVDVKEIEEMATIEDRLQMLEQEQLEIRKLMELQTTAIGALVTKDKLEKLNERHDKLFDTLIAHDRFTNEQLADVRTHLAEVDGKVTTLQTQLVEVDGKVVGLQTQLRQTEKRIDTHLAQVDARLDKIDARLDKIDARLDKMDARFEQVDVRLDKMDTRFDKVEILLTQIVERLSPNS